MKKAVLAIIVMAMTVGFLLAQPEEDWLDTGVGYHKME